DQQLLWATLDHLEEAEQQYTAATASQEDTLDPAHEAAIEAGHEEVVRCQRDVERKFLPGMLGSALLALGALVAGDAISLQLGVVVLAAAVAHAFWLLVIPRRALAVARHEEDQVLATADAGTWLGLHLRRIDDLVVSTDR